VNLHPSSVLGFLLASVYGLVFYLFFGHGWRRLAFYWVIGVVGFFLGQGLANLVGLAIFNIGEMNLVEGTLGSWLCLLAARAWRNN
jgi:hypothetical protein